MGVYITDRGENSLGRVIALQLSEEEIQMLELIKQLPGKLPPEYSRMLLVELNIAPTSISLRGADHVYQLLQNKQYIVWRGE